MSAAAPAEKLRDAARSREAILDAAESLFAERGFDGASLQEIGAAAGLSRATPSYFFGSKERLYRAVLERVFAARQQATADAFAPVRAWCEGAAGRTELAKALALAAEGYLRFLLERPAFVRLLVWEELGAGERLRSATGDSTAMRDAFGALRAAGRTRGLAAFDVDEATLLFVSLTFAPLAHRATLMAALERDLSDAAVRCKHVKLVVDQLMALLTP